MTVHRSEMALRRGSLNLSVVLVRTSDGDGVIAAAFIECMRCQASLVDCMPSGAYVPGVGVGLDLDEWPRRGAVNVRGAPVALDADEAARDLEVWRIVVDHELSCFSRDVEDRRERGRELLGRVVDAWESRELFSNRRLLADIRHHLGRKQPK